MGMRSEKLEGGIKTNKHASAFTQFREESLDDGGMLNLTVRERTMNTT